MTAYQAMILPLPKLMMESTLTAVVGSTIKVRKRVHYQIRHVLLYLAGWTQ